MFYIVYFDIYYIQITLKIKKPTGMIGIYNLKSKNINPTTARSEGIQTGDLPVYIYLENIQNG